MNLRLFTALVILALASGIPHAFAQDGERDDDVEFEDGTDLGKEDAERGRDLGGEGMDEEKRETVRDAEVDMPEGADPEFRKAFRAYQETVTRFAAEITDFQKSVDSVVEAEFKRKAAEVNQRFDARIRASEAVEREYRSEAIASFEGFLERYPDTPRYTPDAIFRLAELKFEKANDDFLVADENYQQQIMAYEAGEVPDPPTDPIRDYGPTIELFERLIADWPDYRLLDGAFYLLAYCELQMGQEERARQLFAELIVKRPDSKFVPEAWIRIGEFHFDYNELELARQAYLEAMKYPDSQFYDKALYKLAWTFYRQDDFDRAIKEFKRLVEYSDQLEEETGQSGSVLRVEAIQYIAISLAEEDWNLDGAKDDDFGIVRARRYLAGDKPYEREVLEQLGEYLFDNTRYAESVDIYRYMLAQYPRHRKNPEVHEKIVLALLRDDRLDEAFAERGKLNDVYGPASDWYAYQQKMGNAEAIRYSTDLVKDNLIQSATWYHAEAQKQRNEAEVREDPDIMAEAQDRYAVAAQGYKDFLERYPNDKDFYQWNFYYAECLYYSGQYMPAYEQYRVVREMDVKDNQFQETSGFNAIKALELNIANLIDSGQLPAKVLPNLEDARDTAQAQETTREEPDEERGDQKRVIESDPIPPVVMQYVTAMDRYVVLGLENEEDRHLDAKFAFQSAKVFYDFNDYPTARTRFEWIVETYPEHEIAYLAGSLILETYREENDFTALAAAAEKLSSVIQGEQADAIREEVRQFQLGAMFKSAEQLFADEEYEKAAEEYLRLLKEDPNNQYAAKALNNAAVAYENVRRYESAMRLYERVYKEHPDDPLASYALFRMAVNQERFFDYDNAIQSYELFYDKYQNKSQAELDEAGVDFPLTEKRGDSLRSAAVLRENMQDYRGAAQAYTRYATTFPENDQAVETSWQAVIAWEKAGDNSRMIDAIDRFNRTYGNDPAQSVKVLRGLDKKADYYEGRNRRRANALYNEIISEYDARGLAPASEGAFFAAKARFMLVERDFEDWEEIQIKGNINRQKKLLETKIAGQKELTEKYESVWEYQSLEWTMASSYRIGNLFQKFAISLYDVPIPFPEGSEEFDIYRTQLEDVAIPLEDEAIVRYEKTIERAREAKIVNEWTKRTLAELNKYKPGEYPLYKEERRSIEFVPVSGQGFVSPAQLNPAEPSGDS